MPIIVNMPKARAIHMDKIREARNVELAKKDIEYMRALEVGDGSAKVIATQKKFLRDIPQTLDLLKYRTPSALRQCWPPGLPRLI
jgi:hypothetical protein